MPVNSVPDFFPRPQVRARGGLLAALFVALALRASAQSLTVTTVAGQFGTTGSADGTGAGARFSYVTDIATDSTGNVFLLDNFAVRKVTPQGVVTTFAGALGITGNVDATGGAARFIQPSAISRDAAGNFFVGDRNRVRKITPAGVVTTTDWAFNSGVTALAFDRTNTLVVGSYTSVRRTLSNGSDVVVAGSPTESGLVDGPSTTARFSFVAGLAVDAAGNYYVADQFNHTIRKITPAGMVSTLAGMAGVAGSADGTGTAARFNLPEALALDAAGNLYVTEVNNHAIRRISPAGVVTTVAGGLGVPGIFGSDGRLVFRDGVGADARLNGPAGIAFDGAGTAYFGDSTTLRKATNATAAAKVIVSPQSQTTPSGQRVVFTVVASGNPAVGYQWQRQTTASGAWTNLAEGPNVTGSTTPVLTIIDPATAINGHRFRCVTSNSAGSEASAPAALTVDPPVVIVPLQIGTLAGDPGRPGPGSGEVINGTARAARFIFPQGLATDAAGNVFVAESAGNRIRRITPAGVVTTYAGTGVAGTADGAATVAQFNYPAGVAVDGSGNVFVADAMNGAIRRISPAGVVSTFAGVGGRRDQVDGTGSAARFFAPFGLVFDATGNLIVVDQVLRGSARRITPSGQVTSLAVVRPDANGVLPPLPTFGGIGTNDGATFYLTDSEHHTVLKWVPATGQWQVIAGQNDRAGSTDGQASAARFNSPSGVAVDAAGNVFVADKANSSLRKITPAGSVTTVAGRAALVGEASSAGTSDGIGFAARFNFPYGLALDRAGNLYIADALNNAIRKAVVRTATTAGSPVVLGLQSPPDHASYQWLKNGVPVSGATSAHFSIEHALETDSGGYAVRIEMQSGVVEQTEPLAVTVGTVPPTPPPVAPPVDVPAATGRIVNLSIRTALGRNASSLTVGFVVRGQGLPLLVRSVGPGLGAFGVASPLAASRLSLFDGDRAIAVNERWDGGSEIAAAAAQVGAFALGASSLDSALLATVGAGPFTAQCNAMNNATGVVLVELYDAGGAATARLVNVSARSFVGSGDEVMIAGFALNGDAPRRVLIRAVGPGLRAFDVSNALADPELRVVAAQDRLVASNDNWGGSADLAAAMAGAGAFPLATDARDSVVLAVLVPGTYSVIVSGVAGATGEALVEIYELDR